MTCRDLTRQNVELLSQAVEVLKVLPDDLYENPEPKTGSSPVGEHVRHCIDFYACLLRDLALGRIDYDDRPRDPRSQQDRQHAIGRIEELSARIDALAPVQPATPLRVKMDTPAEAELDWAESTLGRELQFLASHSVHHFSLIALRLRLAGLPVPDDFGVATATLRHRESLRARSS